MRQFCVKELIRRLFAIEDKPRRGLLAAEWVVLGYLGLTLLVVLLMHDKLFNPEPMAWMRIRILAITLAAWGLYRLIPCRLLLLGRVTIQLLMLSWWYSDTYELNRTLPNLDHLFAQADQWLCGFQPALVFAENWTHPVVSELMHMGYASYFPLIALVTAYYFLMRYEDFLRASFVITASFFAYYLIFIVLPVTGPQFYYVAVGAEQIAQGIFPSMGDYFATHQEAVTLPGYSDGVFYQMVIDAHEAGERPTAAFPSSHVGVTTVLMLLAWRARSNWLLLFMLPFFVLMCLSTVYIQAHYVIDVLGGLVTGVIFYAVFLSLYKYVQRGER